MELIRRIILDVLMALYQVMGISLVTAVLFMFMYLFARDQGWKAAMKKWTAEFKSDRQFRRVFLLALITAMILGKTLFCRTIWEDTFRDVIGVWGIFDRQGKLYTENIENILLIVPFSFAMLAAFRNKLLPGGKASLGRCVLKGAICGCVLSLLIEACQLFLKLGAVQLSDVVYNSVGGLLGGMCYWLIVKWKARYMGRKNQQKERAAC